MIKFEGELQEFLQLARLMAPAPPPTPPTPLVYMGHVTSLVRAALRHEGPIQVIKAIREATGCGLKEAKDIYDAAKG